MRISRRKRPQKPIIPHYKKNKEIKAEELMILDEEGKNIGNMSFNDALAMAEERELDLVEINPKSTPPVAKFIDFTEFKYQKEKEARKQKAHSRASETKGIRLSVRISAHDMETKKNQAEKFLGRGDKVKVELMMKGRENARPDIAKEVIGSFISKIEENVDIRTEQEIVRQGKKMATIIAKK